jgi:acyl carrier protein
MANVEQALKDYIVRELMADRPDATLTSDEPLIEGGIVDSLGIFLLISFIENEFGVKVQPQDVVLDNFATVAAIHKLVQARLADGAAASPSGV